MKCEELALNFFTGPVLSYLERLTKKPMQHEFEFVVSAIANSVKGAARSKADVHSLTGRLATVYKKLDLYRPQMTDGEMQTMVTLAAKFSDADIDRAIVMARSRGVSHIRYIAAVCAGNIGKAHARTKAKITVAATPNGLRPSTKHVNEAWARAVANADDLAQAKTLERWTRND